LNDAARSPTPADVRLARAGVDAARRRLFDRYQRSVMAFCLLHAGRDRDRALDALQETFYRAFRSLDQLDDPERFEGWLFAIARNVCRSRAARRGREDRMIRTLELERELPVAPDDPIEREQRIALVRNLFAAIEDPTLKQIVELKYGEPEHTTRHIAERLGIPHGTVTVKLMRFRAAAKRALLRMFAEEEPA
jgi:RNA polymerase sigma-70 factor (ECF subfamily)